MAAQSRSFFDDVKKELECCVCEEQFNEINEPKILKCLHTFCKSCLEGWLRQQSGGKLSCPTCRQITECPNNSINSLPSNLFCKQMVEIVEAYSEQLKEDSSHCGNCDEMKSLKFYCFDCNCFLCKDCAVGHENWKFLREHHIKEIGNFEASDVKDYARRAHVCKQHKCEVRFFCEQCVLCLCRDCAILEHRDHNIVSIDKGLQKKKSETEVKMSEVQENSSRLRTIKEFLDKRKLIMNNSIDKATEEVHRAAERNIALIRQHESSVTEQLVKQKDAYEAAFANTVAALDDKLNEIESSLKFASNMLERNNLPEILNLEKVLEERFQELLKPPIFKPKLNCSGVKYVPNNLSCLKDKPGKLFTTSTEPSLSLAEGTGLTEGTQGKECTFTVITKDFRPGNKTHSVIDEVIVDIKSLQTGTALKVNINDSKDGCYKVSYKPETAGEFIVSITVAGTAIKGSPFQLKVKERRLMWYRRNERPKFPKPAGMFLFLLLFYFIS